MIEKPSILITSIGRTGTEFFARFFADILPDATSVHEPDVVQFAGVQDRMGAYLRQLRLAGAGRMLFLKALGKWTLIKLSDARLLGRSSVERTAKALEHQRRSFINKMRGSAYVEANVGYYGLLDVTPAVYQRHKAIYIVRDGREWVRSHMSWGELYGKSGLRKFLAHNWPEADQLAQDPYSQKWHGFSRFERLCWAWSRLNQYALETLSKNPFGKVFRFEHLFAGRDRYEHLTELVTFATSLPGIAVERVGTTEGWLDRKSHQSSGGFPPWEEWTADQRRSFAGICGPLMEKLGYEL